MSNPRQLTLVDDIFLDWVYDILYNSPKTN